MPFEVQGYSAQAFTYALCEHKRWTGRRKRRAERIVRLCDRWAGRRPATLIAASMLHSVGGPSALKRQQQACVECEHYVCGAVGTLTFFIFGAVIRAIIAYYVQWYIENHFLITRARSRSTESQSSLR